MNKQGDYRRNFSGGAYAIALALIVHTIAFVFWMGKLSESVDNLKSAVSQIQQTTVSKDSFNHLESRVSRNTLRIEKALQP
jgi:uncharacterized protein YoxC